MRPLSYNNCYIINFQSIQQAVASVRKRRLYDRHGFCSVNFNVF